MSLAESPSLKGGDDYSPSNDDGASCGDSTTPRSADLLTDEAKRGVKAKKRSLFGFAKRKTDSSLGSASSTGAPPSLPEEQSKLSASQATSWPSNQPADVMFPTSPSRALSSSTRVSSPAGSQIFERDVQDSTVLKPNSPAIPTHIQTENYIPPVLDDASEAITNQKLDPDAVEIVTHSSHQPASVTVTGVSSPLGGGSSTPFEQSSSEWAAELASFADRVGLPPPPDNASNYGSLDSADVRRLSFISFADVVQAEHTGGHAAGVVGSRESIHLAGLTSIPSATLNRSPSPIRSPVSSQGPGTSPPTSNPGSVKGVDMSPQRKPVGSPTSSCSHNLANDLNIETMRQALRRTGSADLSNVRSTQTSPVEGGGSR
ncbi:hypothetical protein L249_1933 [Ophiocordyceps polyrhachis-furcata BCC 54312]|uniref:Uncharacterized protein n=1 Tax=Ophiocordyceps polyrhachis-furcata BCC 54312 TaxID=1330021 RepID=A0A367LNQ3_9HYPO|nr:hypothetical protein L249_1933 [Ophiocordyceps polyrhachis-furcata BCC 54312]